MNDNNRDDSRNYTDPKLNYDLDSLLDGTLEELADMPEWKDFPDGVHTATIIGWELKKFDDKKDKSKSNMMMELRLRAQATVETASGSEEVCSPGQESSYSFFLVHHSSPKAMEVGQGQFKDIMKAFAASWGVKSNRELMEISTGSEVLITTGSRMDKSQTPPRKRSQLVSLSVV